MADWEARQLWRHNSASEVGVTNIGERRRAQQFGAGFTARPFAAFDERAGTWNFTQIRQRVVRLAWPEAAGGALFALFDAPLAAEAA